jgi:site-specific recombinase XerD/ribosomal protein L40E
MVLIIIIGMNNYFDVDKYNSWCDLKIKTLLYPEELTETEKERITKFVPKKRRPKTPLLKTQIEVLRRYVRKRRVEDNLDKKTLVMRLSQISIFARFFHKPFDKVTKEDIMGFIEHLEEENTSIGTIDNYKTAIKSFYEWFYGIDNEKCMSLVGWIKRNNPKGIKLPEEILSEEDIARIVDKAGSSRDRAIIMTTFDSGARVGELVNLRIKHLTFDDYGGILMLNGKTGQRRVRLINSVSALKIWLNDHPYRDNPEAPLWICMDKNDYGNPLHRDGFVSVLKKAAKLAGIKKKVNPHAFRHARATNLAKLLTEQELKVFFGWTRESQMASIYVHLSGEDVDRKLLEKAGKLKEGKEIVDKLKPKVCGKCGEENPISVKFCWKCYNPLDVAEVKKIEEVKKIIDHYIYEKLMRDPAFAEKLKEVTNA